MVVMPDCAPAASTYGWLVSAATGTKSRRGSYGSSPARAALYAWALVLISSVYPSGGACATSAGAAVLPAPGWFSTIAGWPHAAASLLARARAMTSTPPPAPNGSMIRTGRSGKAWSRTTDVEDIGA